MKLIITVFLSILLISCVSYRPIFAPNVKYKTVGDRVANQDTDICMEEADRYLKASKKRRAAKEGARGMGVGAIFGAMWGLFNGDVGDVVRGAAVGAGIGGATRGGSVLAEDKFTPDHIKQRYVSGCLGDQGYRILGWE